MGKIKATVLSAKNGVITEKRFQDMTPVQWYFHYMEVLKERKRVREERDDLFESLVSYLELIVMAANPEMGKALREAKELQKLKAQLPDEKLAEAYNDIMEKTPDTITVSVPKRAGDTGLPVYKRKKPGITMPEKREKS